ncbi:MAG: hypothetical protein P1P64_02740 [Treponemataceae bacterium]
MDKKTEQKKAETKLKNESKEKTENKKPAEAKVKLENSSVENSAGDKLENESNKKVRLKVRNKTGRPTYYRAGLCFTQTEADIEVAEDIAETLKKDIWLAVEIIK